MQPVAAWEEREIELDYLLMIIPLKIALIIWVMWYFMPYTPKLPIVQLQVVDRDSWADSHRARRSMKVVAGQILGKLSTRKRK